MSVVKLAEAKSHLNMTGSAHDGELQGFIDVAEAVIANRVGPIGPTTTTVTVRGGETLILPVGPAISLTSVTPTDDGATALTVGDLHLDTAAALITYESGATFGARRYTVVYEAGRTTCPADLKLAVKELVRHLWQTQRGPTRRPGGSGSDQASNTLPGAAYLLPFRVEQLLVPHTQHGFA